MVVCRGHHRASARPAFPTDDVAVVDGVDDGTISQRGVPDRASSSPPPSSGSRRCPPRTTRSTSSSSTRRCRRLLLGDLGRGRGRRPRHHDHRGGDRRGARDDQGAELRERAGVPEVRRALELHRRGHPGPGRADACCATSSRPSWCPRSPSSAARSCSRSTASTTRDRGLLRGQHRELRAARRRRDVRVILNSSEAKVEQAKTELEADDSDASWQRSRQKFSQDQASKDRGGLLEGLVEGQGDPQLEEQAFTAAEGELVGPFETDRGFYLIQVVGITPRPARSRSRRRADAIEQQLAGRASSSRSPASSRRDFVDKWTAAHDLRRRGDDPALRATSSRPSPSRSRASRLPPPVVSRSADRAGHLDDHRRRQRPTGLPQRSRRSATQALRRRRRGGVEDGTLRRARSSTSAPTTPARRSRRGAAAPGAVPPAGGTPAPAPRRRRRRPPRRRAADRGGPPVQPRRPGAATKQRAAAGAAAIARLDEITRRLRRECPWDREQDERSIVPHTVEEAYELADAAAAGDDAKLLDELGDVLFQVHFLSLLLEERGAGDLAAVAGGTTEKLIRRHPHVFGEASAADAGRGARQLGPDQARAGGPRPGSFEDVPENLPALLHARKLQRRAARALPRAPSSASSAGRGRATRRADRARGRGSPSSPSGAGAGPRRGRRATRSRRRSASCCSPASTSPGACAATPSSPCGRPRSASGDRRRRDVKDCRARWLRSTRHPRPADPRLARQPDGRGRRRARRRRARPGRRSLRRVDRRVRGDRAARRRRGVGRQGRRPGGRQRQRRDRRGARAAPTPPSRRRSTGP